MHFKNKIYENEFTTLLAWVGQGTVTVFKISITYGTDSASS